MTTRRYNLPLFIVMLEMMAISEGEEPGTIQVRRRLVPMRAGDSAAWQVCQIAGAEQARERTLIHGTSWRVEKDVVHLTWAVLPDPAPRTEGQTLHIPAAGSEETSGGKLYDPTSEHIGEIAVALHAIRHVAYLAAKDKSIAEQTGQAELIAILSEAGADRARVL